MLHRRLELTDVTATKQIVDGLVGLAIANSPLGTPEEIRAELERFKDFTVYELQEFRAGVLKSEQLNRQFEGILATLTGLYKHLSLSGQSIRAHRELAASDLAILKQGILRLLEDVKIYKLLKLNPTWNDTRIISFRDGRNASPARLRAAVDPRARKLLQAQLRRTSLASRSGVFKPTAAVKYITDGAVSTARKDHGPDKAVDPDPFSFWAEVLLTDRPAKSTYNSTSYDGFIVSLTVDFKQVELVNLIEALPFGLYPVRILNLEYSTDGTTYTQVSGFVEPSASLSWYAIRIDPVPARYVRITLLQENYRSQIYHVSKSVLLNSSLMDHIADDELRIKFGGRSDSEIEKRLAEFDTDTRRLLDGLGRLDKKLLDVVQPGVGPGPIERLSVELAPALEGAERASVRLLQAEPTKPDELLQFAKAEYILGLQHLEACLVQYHPSSSYHSPEFSPGGTLFEVAVAADETHVNLTDAASSTFQASTVEYEVEIGPFRAKPIVPSGKTTLFEVVEIDSSTRTGFVRFSTTAQPSAVYRNGQRLPDADFTFTPSTRKLVITDTAWIPGSVYYLKYTPTAGQDKLDVRTSFDSYPLRRPEQFQGTDPDGKLRLSAPPFINYDAVYDDTRFFKPSQEAKYFYRRDAAQVLLDGVVYGTAETGLTSAITAASSSITVDSASNFYGPGTGEPVGEIRIDDEIIQYKTKTGNVLSSLTRGAKGTVAAAHALATRVYALGLMFYEPVEVFVNGVRARNITDYDKGEHPAFSGEAQNTRVYSYIQAGSNLFFSTPLPGTVIEVKYNVLAQYIKVRALLRSAMPGTYAHTAQIDELRVLANIAEI